MKGRKHTPEQIVRRMREGERLIAEVKSLGEVAKALEVSDYTYLRWRNQYGGLKADDADHPPGSLMKGGPADGDRSAMQRLPHWGSIVPHRWIFPAAA